MDPITILTALSAISGIASMFKKSPKMPGYEAGLSPEDEQALTAMLGKDIDSDTNQAISGLRSSMATRGTFRSGQLPKLESDIRTKGVDAKAKALLSLKLDKANRKSTWQRYMTGLKFNQYNAGQDAGGQGLGQALTNLLRMNQNKGLPSGASSRYAASRPRTQFQSF